MAERAVFTNMCMVSRGDEVLVQRRSDRNWPGIVFPGGHAEPGEAFVESVIREVREETGLTIEQPELCGVKQFEDDDGARYVVFLYRTDRFSGELTSSDEGEVFWVKRDEVASLPLASGVAPMLPIFFGDFPRELIWREGIPLLI
ncbi:MAG: 8-oxo-dGTP diphosphatase [Clostridiales bacterium]|nr:8-oxo-dGTP diphosphatase [Clostridiales bacterium]